MLLVVTQWFDGFTCALSSLCTIKTLTLVGDGRELRGGMHKGYIHIMIKRIIIYTHSLLIGHVVVGSSY